MYELEDDGDGLLAADAARGVRVRVLLDGHYVRRYNAPAYSYLQGHGVSGALGAVAFRRGPRKGDHRRPPAGAIMTMNLTARYYSSSRDFVVFDHAAPT